MKKMWHWLWICEKCHPSQHLHPERCWPISREREMRSLCQLYQTELECCCLPSGTVCRNPTTKCRLQDRVEKAAEEHKGNKNQKKRTAEKNYFFQLIFGDYRVRGIGEDPKTKTNTHFHHSNTTHTHTTTTQRNTNTLPTAKQQKVCQSVHIPHIPPLLVGKKGEKGKDSRCSFFGGLSHERIYNREGVAAPKRPISASGMNCRM